MFIIKYFFIAILTLFWSGVAFAAAAHDSTAKSLQVLVYNKTEQGFPLYYSNSGIKDIGTIDAQNHKNFMLPLPSVSTANYIGFIWNIPEAPNAEIICTPNLLKYSTQAIVTLTKTKNGYQCNLLQDGS